MSNLQVSKRHIVGMENTHTGQPEQTNNLSLYQSTFPPSPVSNPNSLAYLLQIFSLTGGSVVYRKTTQ